MQKESPFPGMDPYLEGHLWPDVHNRLINAIAEMIAPQIAPKYIARIETYTVEDTNPSSEVGITYPDVAILKQDRVEEPAVAYGKALKVTKPDVVIASSVTVRIPVVQIKDTEKNKLITCIEILSPVNKRKPGWQAYHDKKNDLHQAGVHFLEIDLLRRGQRHVWNLGQPEPHYTFSLWRAGTGKLEIWKNFVKEPLPVLPVPLKSPDPDVPLPLKKALEMVYQRGLYHLSIDYKKNPPPPPFSEEET